MKYLKYFGEASTYEAYKNGSDFIRPNVSYVVESNFVHYNPISRTSQKVGDIVYYTNEGLKTVDYTKWKNELGTPVGVITIPTGFAPDGKARMVALSGQITKTWCPESVYTDTSLTNYTVVPITDNEGNTSSNIAGYLPSDKFTGAASSVDSIAKYFETSYLIPSPYLTVDGKNEPNPEYYKEIGENNALSDFNGLENTKTLVELDSTIYQAADHCWTYSDGISTTQWYLPACGELGYMMPRFNEINAGLAEVSAIQLDSSNLYWSSSEYSSSDAYAMFTSDGAVANANKEYPLFARPWAVVE